MEKNDQLFMQLIYMFHASAMQGLGKIADPTGQVNRNLEYVNQTIDLMEMLKVKTKGNISEDIEKGSLIEENAILWPSESNFLPSILKNNYRAMAVHFDSESLTVPMLWPGSRIDLMLSLAPEKKQVFSDNTDTKLIVSNARVLFNSSLSKEDKLEKNELMPQVGLSVIIEVTQKQSETLFLARKSGKLQPILRSLSDPTTIPRSETPVLSEEIGDVVLLPELTKVPSITVVTPQKIVIHRGADVTTVIRNDPEISHTNNSYANAERKL